MTTTHKNMRVTPLGAGRDVGRSCILVQIKDKNIMLDCGMHMGYDDIRRFPDFSFVAPKGCDLNQVIDVALISHFHLDHCGALPYFTEMCGYSGPLIMSAPTRAIVPLLLEDYRRISTLKNSNVAKDGSQFFTSEDVASCMRKVTLITCGETQVIDGIEVTAFYAGHVLGAVMFYVEYKGESFMYTGDYNTTPDRHLGAAHVPQMYRPLNVDVLITEATYATTIRDSKRGRERDFLEKVYQATLAGGKVLIPVFALGRAQELCVLIEDYWARMQLKIPIYYSTGMTYKAMAYYEMYEHWTHSSLLLHHTTDKFNFKHIKPFPGIASADEKGPVILFASPGMLHSGFSLEVFKKWAPDPNNMIIMPGYCVPGTVGARILNGDKKIDVDGQVIDVRCQIKHLSFSAHADARGIRDMIRISNPANVVLIHGEAGKIDSLSRQIDNEFNVKAYGPANGACLELKVPEKIPIQIDQSLISNCYSGKIPNPRNPLEKYQNPEVELDFKGYIHVSEDKQLTLTGRRPDTEPIARPMVIQYELTEKIPSDHDSQQTLSLIQSLLKVPRHERVLQGPVKVGDSLFTVDNRDLKIVFQESAIAEVELLLQELGKTWSNGDEAEDFLQGIL